MIGIQKERDSLRMGVERTNRGGRISFEPPNEIVSQKIEEAGE